MISEMQTIPGTNGDYTYGRDNYGEFGSLVRAESDDTIPEQLDFEPNHQLTESLES